MELLTEQLISLIDKDLPLITNLSNASALLNNLEDINWCGFYIKNGDIAWSSLSKSEIVTPIILDNEVKAVIDIDAPIYNRFNENDQKLLEEIASVLAQLFK